MREKILEAIYKKLEEEPENSHLQKQIVLMNKASISTIHAFCLEVIRNHFYEIGISPNFRMGDTSELELLRQEVIDDLFEEKYESKDEDFSKLIESYTSYRGDDELKELVFRIDTFIQSTPFPEDWLEEAVEKFNTKNRLNEDFSKTIWGEILLENMKEETAGFSLELEALEKKLAREGLSNFALTVGEDKQKIDEFTKITNWEEAFEKANTITFSNWPVDKKMVSNLKDEAKEKRTKIKEGFLKSIENMKLYSSKEAMRDIAVMEPTLVSLKNLVIEFEEKYREAKREKNIIDFHDIEHFALQILITKNEDGKYCPTEAAKEYQEKFVEIAIDEYQDSNLIQDYILGTISRDNNIFMVGDVKQSIYKFRQARPKLFLDKYEEYALPNSMTPDAQGIKILLYKNFRSRKEILEITNEVFQAIMSKRLGEIEYTQEEYLNLGANYKEPEDSSCKFAGKPELHIIDSNIPKEDDEIQELPENSEMEARLVASRIKELLDSNYQIKDKNGFRKATYKDMVILLRAANSIAPTYEKELLSQGIPVFSDTSTQYLDSTEITTILSLLKIIDNPNQDIPLVTVLRSPIYHFDDNELIGIRLKDKAGSFYSALQKASNDVDEPVKQKIVNFLNQIDMYRKKQEYMPLHELLWLIYETTGYNSYISLTPNGALKAANLKMLFQRAKDYEGASFKGLYNFVHYIERLKKSNQDLGAAKIIGENENVVRIMSIHKSKGLEFPIVFLCGTGKGFNFRDLNEKVLLHQDLGFGPKYINYSRQIEYDTLAKEALKNVSKQEAISEEMRVLYVALTRAKEKLIIIGTQKEAEKELEEKKSLIESTEWDKLPVQLVKNYKNYLDWLELVYLKTQKEEKEVMDIYFHMPREFEICEEEKKEDNWTKNWQVSDKLKEVLRKKLEWQYAKKELATIPSKSSVTSLKEIETGQEKVEENIECTLEMPEFLQEERSLSGAQKGTIMHFALQKLNLKKTYSNKEIREFVDELVAEKLLTYQEAESVSIKKIEQFLNSNLASRIRKAKKIYQEKPFYLYLPAKEIYGGDLEEKVVIQGIIDLYYIDEEDNIILVDYKTDFVENNDETILVNKYRSQIETYKRAIEQATGEKVKKTYIYSLYLGKEIEI